MNAKQCGAGKDLGRGGSLMIYDSIQCRAENIEFERSGPISSEPIIVPQFLQEIMAESDALNQECRIHCRFSHFNGSPPERASFVVRRVQYCT